MIDFDKIGELTEEGKAIANEMFPKIKAMAGEFALKIGADHYKDLIGEGFLGMCYVLSNHKNKSCKELKKSGLSFARKAMREYSTQKVPMIRKPQYWPDSTLQSKPGYKPLQPVYVDTYEKSLSNNEGEEFTLKDVLGSIDPALVCNISDHMFFIRQNMASIVKTLDDEAAQVVVLRFVHDFKYREIASALGIKKGKVTGIIKRFVTLMRDKFTKEFNTETQVE